MYKSKLQELCQKRSWELPEYATTKDGPHHMLRFTATVKVHGEVFQTPTECKSAKEAQNTAAQVALDHFNAPPPTACNDLPSPATVNSQLQGVYVGASSPITTTIALPPEMRPSSTVPPILPLSPLPSSLPNPPPGLLAIKNDANTRPATEELLQENCEDTQISVVNTIAIGSRDKCCKDMLHIYKNKLQQYAQKENLGFPVYTTEAEGLPHSRRFKSRVSVGGKTYETLEFSPTLKEAEQAAAKVACEALPVDVIQKDGGLYKNLLQGMAQKKGFLCPSYETVTSGVSHRPTFVSSVTVGTDTFRGAEAKTKKLAEMDAAKVAYGALTKGYAATKFSEGSSINECHVADNLPQNIQPITTIKKHHDTINEEAHLHAKRTKSSSENTMLDSRLGLPSKHGNPPSDGSDLVLSQVENSTTCASVTKLCVDKQQFHEWKVLVVPRKSNLPIPENAIEMPYSDNEWVAYKVGMGNQPTS